MELRRNLLKDEQQCAIFAIAREQHMRATTKQHGWVMMEAACIGMV
jgi:hypothetical protein